LLQKKNRVNAIPKLSAREDKSCFARTAVTAESLVLAPAPPHDLPFRRQAWTAAMVRSRRFQ